MKKEIFTVCVDNYRPELCAVTLPAIQKYADRIGAKFTLVTNRNYLDMPPTYEKVQAYYKGMGNDYNVLIDADMLINDNFPDVTTMVPPDAVGIHMQYQADLLFAANDYFMRDGRKIGLASNFMVVPKWCHDVLTPLVDGIVPSEVTKRVFIIDEYCFSYNLARYGLKVSSLCKAEDLRNMLHLNVTTGSEKDCVEKAKKWLAGGKVAWPWKADEGSL